MSNIVFHFPFGAISKSIKALILISTALLTVSISAAQLLPAPSPLANSSDARFNDVHEDWTSPALADTHLVPIQPLLGLIDDKPRYTVELLQVQWRRGDPIDLYVMKPKGVKKPPVILYLYGYPSTTDIFRNDAYEDLVTKNGFAAVGFVSALTGHRYHDRPLKQWFLSELQESLATSAHDVQMVLNYLASRDDLDMDRIGMFATGSGASIAILTSAVDPRIKVLEALDPWSDWPTWLATSPFVPEDERAQYVTPDFLKRVAPLDPLEWLPKVQAKKFRLDDELYGRDTPNPAKERLRAAVPDGARVVVYNTPNEFKAAFADGKNLEWIQHQLQSRSLPAATTSWVLRYPITASDGRRVENIMQVGLVRDLPKEKDAWREVDKLGLSVRINGDPCFGRIRFSSLAEHYLKADFGADAVRPKSVNTIPIVEHYVRDYLIKRFGENIAEDIKPIEIQKWLKSLNETNGLAWPTIAKIRGLMLRIYKIRLRHEHVAKNPVLHVETRSKSTYRAIIITPAQTLTILKSLVSPLHYTLVLPCAATALRSSETLALRWADVLWSEGKIRVSKRWAKGEDGETKTNAPDGYVPLHPVLAGHLLAWHLLAWQRQTPHAKATDFMFPSMRAGGRKPLCSSVFVADHLRPAAKKAGVHIEDGPRFGLHNSRHSLSNWLVEHGESRT